MPSLIFDPLVTIEECDGAGRQFGLAWGTRARAEFEEALTGRLAALGEALASPGLDAEEALAAFDQAAWAAWEVVQVEAVGGVGASLRSPRFVRK